MTKDIVILDLFSGIGGFSKGLSEAGFNIKKHYFSEIDKHAIAVYKHNFKNAIYAGSVTTVRGTDIERPNIITFGSPCQDFSLAGKRAGMDGERSSLILHAMCLIDECRPDFFIWENVKGAFSSNNSADFWAIIQAFANIGGYRLEWQLLNTSWVLPQNRERIYLVGHLAVPGRSFRPVFPFGEQVKVSNESAGNTKEQIASCLQGCGGHTANGEYKGMNLIKVRSATSSGYEEAAPGDSINFSVPNSETRRGRVGKGVAQTLDTQSNQAVIVRMQGRNPDNPSSRKAGLPTVQMLEPNSQGIANNLSTVQKDNLVIQLNSSKESNGQQPYQQNRVYDANGISTALDQAAGKWSIAIGTWRTHKDGQGFREVKDNNSPTIPARAREDGSGQPVISIDAQIRRLTEIECERLQGFPDNWTALGDYDGVVKPVPQTQRYKQCGNAVTVDIVRLIGERLIKYTE